MESMSLAISAGTGGAHSSPPGQFAGHSLMESQSVGSGTCLLLEPECPVFRALGRQLIPDEFALCRKYFAYKHK